MALETHERIVEWIEFTDKRHGSHMRVFAMGRPIEGVAQKFVDDGQIDVVIVRERDTWKGKNGKHTYTPISRTPIQ